MREIKEYISSGEESQELIDRLINELRIMGHSDDMIQKIGIHSGLFVKNPRFNKKSLDKKTKKV